MSIVSQPEGVALLKKMLIIRNYEELTAYLFKKGYIRSSLHHAVGQEACAVGTCTLLNKNDVVTAGHRIDHIALAKGVPMDLLLAETMGLKSGLNAGNAGPMHVYDREHGFWGANGIVAANVAIGAGIALSKKLKNEKGVVVAFTGDGATTEGSFHESMNMAALYKVPLVVVCENNLYAQSTSIEGHSAVTDLTGKVKAMYGVDSSVVDGNDLVAVLQSFYKVISTVTRSGEPYFLELQTYRISGHSINDEMKYRTKDEVKEWEKRDPIERFKKYLIDEGIMKSRDIMDINMEVENEMRQAVKMIGLDIKL